MRSSARDGDYGNRQLDLNVPPDYNMSIEDPESHNIRHNSADLLNAEIDYNQDHVKQYIREDNHDYGEDFPNGDGQVEPNQMDDRWDGQRHDPSNGNDIEHEMELDRYAGYERKADSENHQIVYSRGSPAEDSLEDKIARELIGEETSNHPKDSKVQIACYSCGALGHKKRNCPHENTSRKYSSRFDRRHDDDIGRGGRGKGSVANFGSSSQAKLLQHKDPQRTKRFKDTRKASVSGKSGRLIENRSSSIGKETDRAWEKDNEGKKRSRRRGGTPLIDDAKKARPNSSLGDPDHNASRSHSKSKSTIHMPRSILESRSISISSRACSSSKNLKLSAISHHSRSRSSKSSLRSRSPRSLSSPVSHGKPLASYPDKGQLTLKVSLDNPNTPESKEIMVGGDAELENAKFENRVAPVTIENAGSSAKVESEVEKDQAMQGGNSDNHMTPSSVPRVKNLSTPLSEKDALADESLSPENSREIKGSQDFDALTTEDAVVPPVETDSEPTTVRSTSISSEELFTVMKHYGLEPPDENERNLSAEAYYGAARMWPWEIIYYRRLKKGPISTENYARRVAQNKEFGIVDKYIRSSTGWGELNHH